MTDELSSFYETSAESKAAIEKQLGKEAKYIASKQKRPREIEKIQEKGTAKTKDIGGFTPRIGVAEWNMETAYTPKTSAHNNCVGLPMGRYMESQYEAQNGHLEMWNKQEVSDMKFLEFQKIM